MGRLRFEMGSFAKDCLQLLINTISIKTLEKYLPSSTYSPKLRAWLETKYTFTSFLAMLSRQWWPSNPKDFFSVTLKLWDFILVVNKLVCKSSDLSEFNQTHNAAMFSSKCEIFDLQIHHIYARVYAGGVVVNPPLSLVFYKNVFVCANDINCFRIHFAC